MITPNIFDIYSQEYRIILLYDSPIILFKLDNGLTGLTILCYHIISFFLFFFLFIITFFVVRFLVISSLRTCLRVPSSDFTIIDMLKYNVYFGRLINSDIITWSALFKLEQFSVINLKLYTKKRIFKQNITQGSLLNFCEHFHHHQCLSN